MGKHDMMKDPYFAHILFHIESRIVAADQEARLSGNCIPKDSAVKSALRKAKLALDGKKPANPPKDKLEEWTVQLSQSLATIGQQLVADEDVTRGDFARALDGTCDSLDTRREMSGTPRGYLDFLEQFISQAGILD